MLREKYPGYLASVGSEKKVVEEASLAYAPVFPQVPLTLGMLKQVAEQAFFQEDLIENFKKLGNVPR